MYFPFALKLIRCAYLPHSQSPWYKVFPLENELTEAKIKSENGRLIRIGTGHRPAPIPYLCLSHNKLGGGTRLFKSVL